MAWSVSNSVAQAVQQAIQSAPVGQKRRAAGTAVKAQFDLALGSSPNYLITVDTLVAGAHTGVMTIILKTPFEVTERGVRIPAGAQIDVIAGTVPTLAVGDLWNIRIGRQAAIISGKVGLPGTAGADATFTVQPASGTNPPLSLVLPMEFTFPASLDQAAGMTLADSIWATMSGPNDGTPSGTGFATAVQPLSPARVGLGIHDNQTVHGNAVTHALAWGSVYEAAGFSNALAAPNTRVQTRNMRVGVRNLAKLWAYIDRDDVSNMEFSNDRLQARVDYIGGGSVTRIEPDGGRSWKPPAGWHAHFWSGMPTLTINNVDALWATYEARLVLDNASLPDDRSAARYICTVGLDYKTAQLLNGEDTGDYDSIASSRKVMVPTDGNWVRVFVYVDRSVTATNTQDIAALEAGLRAHPPALP